ncbi:MAG: PhzF family phenazine biosynthesis protein [Candidatus Rifleibacteriota bacterium]
MDEIKDTVEVLVINSFVLNGSGGNPAGVVLNLPGHLRNEKVMQKIAAVAGFSETVFLENPGSGSKDLRFFTPENEIDFCGHATLAMFFAFRAAGMLKEPVANFSTGVGSIKVLEKCSGEILMQQVLPEFKQKFEMMEICEELGLSSSHVEKSLLPPQIVSTGVPDLIMQISSIEHLEKLEFSPEALKKFSRHTGSAGMHAFSIIEKGEIWEIAARNFAPLFGIAEESATGSASGALACYLHRHCKEAPTRFRILQGQFMGLPSEINAELEIAGGTIAKVMVGGRAAFMKKLELNSAGL